MIKRTAIPHVVMSIMLLLALGAGAERQAGRLPTGPVFDVVLRGGRVIDPESEVDAVRDVGIVGDRIAAVSEQPLEGRKVIDVRGMIVAPGFIDLHSHAFDLPGQRMQACDGVTTALELESGVQPIGAAYEMIAQRGAAVNYGFSSSWTFSRIAAMIPQMPPPAPTAEWYLGAFRYPRWTTDVTTDAELTKVLAMLEDGLRQGGLGIGVNAGYVPGVGGKELTAVSELAARHGVPTFTHLRDWSIVDPNSSVEGLNMLIGLSATTGVHSHVCHLNSTSLRDGDVTIRMIEAARQRGLNVTTEAYPYGMASFPITATILMRNAKEFRERIGIDFDKVRLIAKGRQIVDEADIRREQKDSPGQLVIMSFLDESDAEDRRILDATVTPPWSAIASDAVPWNLPDGSFVAGEAWPLPANAASNPRSAGTFCRFLRVYVRERSLLSWIDAIRKMTIVPATILGDSVPQMKRKGRLQVGMDADIVVIDPATVSDRATPDHSAQTSQGIRYLFVHGTMLIEQGALDPAVKPGRPIRRSVEAK
jgi:N-acyl-D-glutamate deacylase